jgi:kumamolisin
MEDMQHMNWSTRIMVGTSVALLTLGAMAQERGASTGKMKPEAQARGQQIGMVVIPQSGVSRPEDAGLRFHTTVQVRSLDGKKPLMLNSAEAQAALANPEATTTTIETPSSLGCLYVSSPKNPSTGCVPNFFAAGGGGPSKGGWGAIALVDAYDNPFASTDLAEFVKYFKLAKANFTKIYANGNGDCTTPPANAGWALESSLDIEWAHVYAPSAAIVLVEACSNSDTDLYYAEQVAINYIQQNYGGGDVSNSWAGGEYSGEVSSDPIFTAFGETYYIPVSVFASADDAGCGAAYPSSNPYIVSAGGTTVNRNTGTLTFNNESCWAGSGGGTSVYETYGSGSQGAQNDYQYPIFGEAARATPDIAGDADPASGVAVAALYYGESEGVCSAEPCFFQVGGTSVSSPSLASIVNRANNRMSSWYGFSVDSYGFFYGGENTLLYSQIEGATAYYTNFYDVTTGSNGCTVTYNWDYCTGVGSPRGLLGK